MKKFDLKLATGKVATWSGEDGHDAARRYLDCHRDDTVVAIREHPEPIRVYAGEPILSTPKQLRDN